MILTRFEVEGRSARPGVIGQDGRLRELAVAGLFELAGVRRGDLPTYIAARLGPVIVAPYRLTVPIDGETEVWASGVTYLRSKAARQEESQVADVYALVYDADRPELFYKSNARRCVGPDDAIGIREDSPVNVPEPELALLTNAFGEVIAAAICDDVSSRSIEGENPLYLPQAKIYAGSCALGPGWTLVEDVDELGDRTIDVEVTRAGEHVWRASTSTSLLHRSLDDLTRWLHRADWFPHGAVLSTGTGVVPDLDFTLEAGDRVTITIAGLGVLSNPVEVGCDAFRHLPRVEDYASDGARR